MAKYKREDFGPLKVKLEHMELYINFFEDRVEVKNTLSLKLLDDSGTVSLDAKELEVRKVLVDGKEADYEYDKGSDKLKVKVPGSDVRITTETVCYPSDTVLEGIYRDVTPEGAPQQYMSQCQQWGFQRIAPTIDDCRAKCAYRTTLEGDARYTHLISNGNIDKSCCPEGLPVIEEGRKRITYVNNIPMTPYLFIAAAGTWDVLADSVDYPYGRRVRLEYLVPKGMVDKVKLPMQILKKSILWIKETQDYEYKQDVYRTICMTKSNFGGMENVGNTTIVTDAAVVDEHTLDGHLLYAHGVIVHEFEHNQCGSETTMATPFDVWLNEGYTVDVERQFKADVFGKTFMRLDEVDSIRSPLLGPLSLEDTGTTGRVAREGFNDPNDLIDGVTYVKAAEVIRMLRLVMGEESFKEAKMRYFNKFHNSNADTDDFFDVFEEVHGQSLDQFKKEWLFRIGYPKVRAETSYHEPKREFRIKLTQECDGAPFHVPIQLGLVDEKGKDIEERVVELRDEEADIIIENVDKPAFASINRDYSFYGTFSQEMSKDDLLKQAKLDPNLFNRVEAVRRLKDMARVKLLEDPKAPVDEGFLKLYAELLSMDVPTAIKARFLGIGEQPLDRKYIAWYKELVDAREKMMKAVNARYRGLLLKMFESIDTYNEPGSIEKGIADRMLKSTLLGLIAIDDSAESQELVIGHHKRATNANDTVSSLALLNKTSSPKRRELLDKAFEDWHHNLNGYANYLRVVASGTHDKVFDEIEAETKRESFDMSQPSHTRALFMPMTHNNKMLWTDEGMEWLKGKVIEMAKTNPYIAGKMLSAFQHVNRMKPELAEKVKGHIEDIAEQTKHNASVSSQAKSYLGDS